MPTNPRYPLRVVPPPAGLGSARLLQQLTRVSARQSSSQRGIANILSDETWSPDQSAEIAQFPPQLRIEYYSFFRWYFFGIVPPQIGYGPAVQFEGGMAVLKNFGQLEDPFQSGYWLTNYFGAQDTYIWKMSLSAALDSITITSFSGNPPPQVTAQLVGTFALHPVSYPGKPSVVAKTDTRQFFIPQNWT